MDLPRSLSFPYPHNAMQLPPDTPTLQPTMPDLTTPETTWVAESTMLKLPK
jgi:hypothetical protein